MMKQEFEAIAGYTVSDADYKRIIEPMYLATSLGKQEFVACLDKKRFAQPSKKDDLAKLKRLAAHYVNYLGWDDWRTLEEAFRDYAERFYHVSGGKDEWCWLREKEAINGCILEIYGSFGRDGCLSEDVILYKKK